MKIENDTYRVQYDADKNTVVCSGSFRLTGNEYAKISEILNVAADAKPEMLTLDLTELQFLNSSGINTLSKFIIRLRKHKASQVYVKGSSKFAWQKKSLANFKKLIPDLVLEFN